MSSRDASRRNDSSGEERQGIQPRYRRAFGCVTWVYMAILTFLAAAFLLTLPFRYIGGDEIFGYALPRLAFFGLVLILPGMALGAVLGARTYRAPVRLATRVGAGIGAVIGWTSFFTLAWFAVAFDFDRRDQAFRTVVFPGIEGGAAFYVFPPLVLLSTGLVLYALYAKQPSFERRRRLALLGAALAVLTGLVIVASDFDPLGIAGALISTLAAALGGWVGGAGYARAGGDDMIPPDAVRK